MPSLQISQKARTVSLLAASLFIFLSDLSIGSGVYKCKTPNGDVTYSDTACEGESDGRETIDTERHELTPEEKAEIEREEVRQAHQEAKANYLERRAEMKEEMEAINLGLDQTLGDLMENKARHSFLKEELERLEAAWLNYIDPEGASERAMDRRLEELEERVERAERKARSGSTRIRINGEYHTCRRQGSAVNCW